MESAASTCPTDDGEFSLSSFQCTSKSVGDREREAKKGVDRLTDRYEAGKTESDIFVFRIFKAVALTLHLSLS